MRSAFREHQRESRQCPRARARGADRPERRESSRHLASVVGPAEQKHLFPVPLGKKMHAISIALINFHAAFASVFPALAVSEKKKEVSWKMHALFDRSRR